MLFEYDTPSCNLFGAQRKACLLELEVYNGHLGGLRSSLIYCGKLLSWVLGGSLGGSGGVLGASWDFLGGPWGAWGLFGGHLFLWFYSGKRTVAHTSGPVCARTRTAATIQRQVIKIRWETV